MGRWRKNEPQLHALNELIERNPGILPSELAARLGVARSTVARRLPVLDEAGLLVYEDEEGRLWPFGHKH